MFKQYYQLTKPGIVYGNLVTAAAGFFLASAGVGHLYYRTLIAVLVGIALVIGSACVFNNYIDRDIDTKMSRTKKRAIATGKIKAGQALTYATILGIVGFVILGTKVNMLTVYLGALAFFVYVVLYGWSKRNSVHGTVVGSISGAIPPVAGYCAVTNHIDGGALLLFIILVLWQMPHFYAIAIYRYDDYKNAGLPVLPVKKGMAAAKLQIIGYIAAFTVAVSLLTVFGYTGYIYLVVILALSINWFRLALKGLNAPDDKKWARKIFFYSLIMTLSLSIMLSVGGLLP